MANTYLTRTQSSTGSETKGTFSAWVKRSGLTTASNMYTSYQADNEFCDIQFNSSDQLQVVVKIGGTDYLDLRTTRLFRDVSAFYHIVVVFDSTDSTQADRCKIYVNGTRETSFATNTNNVSSSLNMRINGSSQDPYIGSWHNQGNYFDGSMTHIHWIDGTAYDASTFAESDSVSGIWKPKTAPSVTYGTNGFFLKMENSGAMGTDSSGNSNTFTVNGTLTQNVDTPSNNFATLNGINVGGGTSTLSNGNTTYSLSNYSYNTRSTLGMPSGKFYWEQKVNASSDVRIGLCTSGFTTDLDTDNANAYYGGSGGGGVYILLSASSTSWQRTNNDTSRNIDTYSTAIASGSTSILMGAVDVDAGKLWVGVDGVWMNSGNPATRANPYDFSSVVNSGNNVAMKLSTDKAVFR